MALLEQWRGIAYNDKADKGILRKLWDDYFLKEKEIYEQLLADPRARRFSLPLGHC